MIRTSARRSRPKKRPMARPNEPDMLPKRTKKIRLGIYRIQIRPKTRRYFFVHASARQCSRVQFGAKLYFSLLALNKLLFRLTNVIVLRFVVFLL